jgi:hypothetical protein
MSVQNIVSISTNHGYKTIEIHHDDLSKLSFPVDVLVISAFKRGYHPTPGTLIHALEVNANIVINDLAKNPLYDFRETLNSWVSNKVDHTKFNHVICLEGLAQTHFSGGDIEHVLEDLLAVIAVLQQKGININTIALPFLGTGNQQIELEFLVPLLIKKSKVLLESIGNVQTIYFVHPDLAKVQLFDQEINRILKRQTNELELIRSSVEIATALDQVSLKLLQNFTDFPNRTIEDFAFRIIQPDIKFYELGILARRTMEVVLKDFLNNQSNLTLHEMLVEMRNLSLNSWMLSYFHTIRTFGNSLAHDESDSENSFSFTKEDILFFTSALVRFVDIMIHYKNQKASLTV